MFLLAEKAKAARTGSTGVFFLFCFFFYVSLRIITQQPVIERVNTVMCIIR